MMFGDSVHRRGGVIDSATPMVKIYSTDDNPVDAGAWACFEKCLDCILACDGSGMISYLEKLNPTMQTKTLNVVVNSFGTGGSLLSYVVNSEMTAQVAMEVIRKLLGMGIAPLSRELRSLVLTCITKASTDFVWIIEALFMSFPGLTQWVDEFLCAAVKYSNFPAATSIASVGGDCQAVFLGGTTLLHVAVMSCIQFRRAQRQSSHVDVNTAVHMVKVHRSIIMFLLHNGANPKMKNTLGDAAIDVAVRCPFMADVANMLRTARFLSRSSVGRLNVNAGGNSSTGEDDVVDHTSRFRQCVSDVKTIYTNVLPCIPLFASSFTQNFLAKQGFSFAAKQKFGFAPAVTRKYVAADMFMSPEDYRGVELGDTRRM